MTIEEWEEACSSITDRLKEHVRPFVCPLSKETVDLVQLIGTGSFVNIEGRVAIITCEHVAAKEPLYFRYSQHEDVFGYRGEWISEREPIDVAWTKKPITPAPEHSQAIVPRAISKIHSICRPEKPLYFYGFSGENSAFSFDQHVTNGTGYLTQQNKEAIPDASAFELLWPPLLPKWSKGTTSEARKKMRFSDPRGFSGALVWNTRFFETGGNLDSWTPDDARVTGVLKRFDDKESILLVTPIECVRKVTPFSS